MCWHMHHQLWPKSSCQLRRGLRSWTLLLSLETCHRLSSVVFRATNAAERSFKISWQIMWTHQLCPNRLSIKNATSKTTIARSHFDFQLGSERWHYCAACEAVSPPRAWHCSGGFFWSWLWHISRYSHYVDMSMVVFMCNGEQIWVIKCLNWVRSECWNCSVSPDLVNVVKFPYGFWESKMTHMNQEWLCLFPQCAECVC